MKHQKNRETEQNMKKEMLHLETINMMSKYQLVYIKLESGLSNFITTAGCKQTND
jgi:hypothetical protein